MPLIKYEYPYCSQGEEYSSYGEDALYENMFTGQWILETEYGYYLAETKLGLKFLVFRHRLWHWLRGEGWRD